MRQERRHLAQGISIMPLDSR